jgi:glutamyl-tRNA(Gln) amidotransferase subunit D
MKPGDRVRVEKKSGDAFEGLLIPAEREGVLVLKLDNGYNIGIEKENVKSSKVIEEHKGAVEDAHEKVTKNPKLPTIAILHTGGTIASMVDYRTGGVVPKFTPAHLISMFPELGKIANIESELIANMWSDDLRFANISRVAQTVEKYHKKGVDGIIVSMGTDNLAVGSAGLAFCLEACPIPVIFVGAQRSSDRGSSDAAMNLICAAYFITHTDFAGVALCMHEHTDDSTCLILPATKTRKLHSSRRDAFKPVNDSAIARVDYDTKKIEFLREHAKREKQKMVVKPKFEGRVGLLKIHVNMFPEQFELYKGWKGLVIEGTGLGQTPGHVTTKETEIHKKIFPAIQKVSDSGCVVVMTTMCLFGRVSMNVYDKARDLQRLGVIPGEDMLPETALVKLAWLLANHPKEVKELIGKNLRGEINERILPDEYIEESLSDS